MQQTPRVRRSLAAGALIAATLGFPLPAAAHHGWGGYADSTSELTGTVASSVSTAGPHATMKVNVDGQVWDVVLAPPARTEAGGLKDGMLPLGTKVTVHGNRHRDPKKFEIKTSRVTWNDRVFNVYPDRP